ncbi:VWA domain-containing protein [Erythrobacter dokdonensis]|uniref:Flp pilus assembly protein TadG n=1 Tax=Erythrobacter dokdonensis DSW-74 TaxID=1300349 RepID=A0A1A7BLF7_9SPHN|nr:VWA domain-containing protein [Erythrobacter dokdonensis]OBV12561.1 Flp pilus assembly protein TadG [Erythrobacter dokdonensis DSW-74]
MERDYHERRSFLRALLHDRTANTIVISAAALVPLMAMVGGGVDASRYYMTAARMQAACDAGALAARRAMLTDEFTSEHKQIGLDFYDQNFSQGMFGLQQGVRDYTSDGEGVVNGTASGTLPTSIMGAFGFDDFQISVSCSAEINISNTDIMFVLDTTGSMAECPDGSSCSGGPGSKIAALREAVMGFYDTVEDATAETAQIRYGIVPYSQQVNVGFSIPQEYMATRHTYQSRVARFREQFTFIPGNGVEVGDELVISDQWEWLPRSTANFGSGSTNHYRFRTSGSSARESAQDFCWDTLPGTYTVDGVTWKVFEGTQYYTGVWSGGNSNNRGGCAGRVRKTKIATEDDVIEDQTIRDVVWQDYVYCPVDTDDATPCNVENPADSPPGWETVDLSTLYDDNQIQLPTGNEGAMENHTWTGCIEEPTTVLTDNYSPIPPAAHDLNINLVPASEEQRWKPSLNRAVWERTDGSGRTLDWLYQTWNESRPSFACPRAAIRLTEIPRTDLQTYVNSLNPSGQTYHDIGMLWGARFISPRGLFAADNETAPNGDAIARHIVFMTDGIQVNNIENYSTHGIEWWDRRISGDGNAGREFNRRAARLQAICRAARQENITVWVVAFGVALSQNLIDCASPGRAFQADDAATLNERFQEIAQKIAALRLTS